MAPNKNFDSLLSVMQTGIARQIMFLVGIAISVAVGIVLYSSIQEPVYRPLDYQVTPQNLGAIVDALDKSGIQYKINEKDNIIMVAAKDVQTAKIKLSSAGVAKDDGFTYSFLNEQNSFANSQFLENARYLRALENDLGKTISAIEGISGAKVHIAIPQNNIFADENNKVTASVVLSIAAGLLNDKEKIRSIIQIVADSVPGLDPKNVAITDQYGHFLSNGFDQNTIYNAEQLAYQNNMQSYYEKRIESLIMPILGENKVAVRVNADIDFTQTEDAQEEYDPTKKVIRSEQSEIESADGGGASGTPGALSNSPPSEDASKGAASQSSSGGQSKTQSTKNYEVTKSVTYKKSNYAKIKNLSVAVVVDDQKVLDPKTKQYISKPLDKDTIAKITDLVKATIGFNPDRGDKVTVVNSGYTTTEVAPTVVVTRVWDQPWFWDMVKKILGITFGCVFLLIFYKSLTNFIKSPPRQAQKISKIALQEVEAEEDAMTEEMMALKQERMNKLKQLATTEPNKVALIIKSWVNK